MLEFNTKMSVVSVVSTFVLCILFNIILPTGDINSDLYLMYQTLTFNLGESLELEGCKSCFHKTEKDVYYPDEDLTNDDCKTCLFDRHSYCGSIRQFIKKVRTLKNEIQTCSNMKTFRITGNDDLKDGKCDELTDSC